MTRPDASHRFGVGTREAPFLVLLALAAAGGGAARYNPRAVPLTFRDFRRIALGMAGAVEGAHMGHPDFRVHGRIFASLPHGMRTGMVVLTPEQQQRLVREDPSAFMPESGAWGRAGCTRRQLDGADEECLSEALTLAALTGSNPYV
ncbi:MAG TPA: hypothetical protein VNI78_11730 [Vicinamibacterales bacterium]|nr:hypothetical protein [Vicinamibacterales bacterium]